MCAISTFNNLLVQPYLIQDEKCVLLTDSCSVLNGWANYFCQLLNVHQVNNIRQPEIHSSWDIVIWAKCLLRLRWLFKDTNQWVLIKFHQNWYSTFLYDIWRLDWYSIFAYRVVSWLMFNHVSQQFCVGCDCFIVAVFHWHGVLLLYTLKSYMVEPFSRIVWPFGTKSECWNGLSILQWK